MDLFSIDLSPGEMSLLRQSLDLITITGKDAKFVANLQMKLEHELSSVQQHQDIAAAQKKQELEQAIAADRKKKQASS